MPELDENPLDFLSQAASSKTFVEDDNSDDSNSNPPPETPPKKKEPQAESARKLREERDAIIKERDELKKQLDEVKGKASVVDELKPFEKVASYLKTKKGKDKVEEVDVDEFIEKNRKRKKALEEKEQQIFELDINRSETWKRDYEEPVTKAHKTVQALVVNPDSSGKVIAPELTGKFMDTILKPSEDGSPKTPLEIKAEISKFKKAFFDANGFEYEAPPLKEISLAVEEFHSRIHAAKKARANWAEESKKRELDRLAKEEQAAADRKKTEILARDRVFSSSIEQNKDFYKEFDGIFTEDEVKTAAKEEHNFMQSSLRGDKDFKPRNYDGLVSALAKAKLFDNLAKKFKESQQEIEKLKKKAQGNGLPMSGGSRSRVEQHQEPQDDDENPTDFLKS